MRNNPLATGTIDSLGALMLPTGLFEPGLIPKRGRWRLEKEIALYGQQMGDVGPKWNRQEPAMVRAFSAVFTPLAV